MSFAVAVATSLVRNALTAREVRWGYPKGRRLGEEGLEAELRRVPEEEVLGVAAEQAGGKFVVFLRWDIELFYLSGTTGCKITLEYVLFVYGVVNLFFFWW